MIWNWYWHLIMLYLSPMTWVETNDCLNNGGLWISAAAFVEIGFLRIAGVREILGRLGRVCSADLSGAMIAIPYQGWISDHPIARPKEPRQNVRGRLSLLIVAL
jgi:hypothetical protein